VACARSACSLTFGHSALSMTWLRKSFETALGRKCRLSPVLQGRPICGWSQRGFDYAQSRGWGAWEVAACGLGYAHGPSGELIAVHGTLCRPRTRYFPPPAPAVAAGGPPVKSGGRVRPIAQSLDNGRQTPFITTMCSMPDRALADNVQNGRAQ